MNILDNHKQLVNYNTSGVMESIGSSASQIFRSWHEISSKNVPRGYKRCQNIVFCGMGGSNLSSELLRAVFGGHMHIPFVLVKNYHLPKFVNKKSLVIISSYSGNTEETVQCFVEAMKARAAIFCIASGGRIIDMAKKHRIPFYQLPVEENPSAQPRYGVGLQLGAVLGLFSKIGLIRVGHEEIEEAIAWAQETNGVIAGNVPIAKNPAKKMAEKLHGRVPIIVSAEFLGANGHIMANQINESAKNMAWSHEIPELNHHLMEGLVFPEEVKEKITFVFINAEGYSAVIKKRFAITQKVLKKQGIEFMEYVVEQPNRLAAALEILGFGSWLSFYMAVLAQKDPAQIPWVNFFKKELQK